EILTALRKLEPERGAARAPAQASTSPTTSPGEKGLASANPPAVGIPRRWTGCIKLADWSPDRDTRPTAQSKPAPPVQAVGPAHLRELPVFKQGEAQLVDPPERSSQPLRATTCNSNTQFATLALWVARRHGVPIDRSLRLIVRRFRTSQN